MRKRNKRIVSVLMTALMAASLLAGCGDKDVSSDNSQTAEESGSVPTYRVAIVRWSSTSDFLEGEYMKKLEESYGINIEWEVYPYSDWSEQKSLLLASGDLPDAFFGSLCLNTSDLIQNSESFMDLGEYINEKTMPNLTAAIKETPELLAVATERDGRVLSLPKQLPLRPKVCGYLGFINQQWLDNLGLQMPANIQELEDVLYAFATEDADGDGDPTNEFAYSNAASNTRLSIDLRFILSPFGTMVSRADNYMGLDSKGEPVFMPAQDNYYQAVQWMHGLWEKGILDPEYFTQDDSMYAAKAQAKDGSRVGLFYAWAADAGVGTENQLQFTVLPAVEGYEGRHYVENAETYLNLANREFVVTNNCKEPEKLLSWADAFYSDLVALQAYYGSIDDGCITDNGDGTYTVNVPEDGTSLDASAWANGFRDHGPKYISQEFQEKVILPEDQGDGLRLALDEVNLDYITTDTNQGMPPLHYTEEEESRISSLGTNIYSYAESMYAHWVVDGGVEEEWDGYIEKLNQMGLQELLDIQKKAYGAYKEVLDSVK